MDFEKALKKYDKQFLAEHKDVIKRFNPAEKKIYIKNKCAY